MAAVASNRKRTIVRNLVGWHLSRTGFMLGSWLAPGAAVRYADRLFGTPARSSRERALQADLGGAKLEFMPWQGERLAVYRWGDLTRQPVVLFAHGWSSFGLRCLAWVQPLRDAGYAVVSFDQVGHGRSSGRRNHLPGFAAALAAVVRHVSAMTASGARPAGQDGCDAAPRPLAALIGHSLGGAAIMLALAEGTRARRAILVAPPADLTAASHRFARFIGLAEHLVRRLLQRFEQRTGVAIDQLRPGIRAPAIATPGLIVHDCADREVPWEEGERYARSWPTARLLSTTGLGHNRIVDDARIIAAGLGFLRGQAVGERVVSSPNLPLGVA